MPKTYLDILSKRGIEPFLTKEQYDEVAAFCPKAEYAIPDRAEPVFRSPKQHQIQVGKNSNLIADMCWYGATGEELVRAIKHGTVVLDADKHHLDWQKSGEDFCIQELYQKYRRFNRRPKLTEREKLVITAYTGYVLDGTAGKVVDFVEAVLGHSNQTPEPPKVPVILEVHNALRGEFCEICRKHHMGPCRLGLLRELWRLSASGLESGGG